jgi:hypothetical protein
VGAGDVDLSHLFRFVLARSIGTKRFLEVAENFEPGALFLFSLNPKECQAVYGADGHLPEGFAGKAEWYGRLIELFDQQYGTGVG